MRIMMTGSKGYLGTHIIKRMDDINSVHEIVEYEGEITEFFPLGDYDLVLHLAGLAGVRQSVETPDQYWKTNVEGSKCVFNWCEQRNTPVVYFSSSNAAEWWTNPYAMTKKACEALAPSNAVGIRPSTVWPGREDMFYRKLERGEVEYVNGGHYRDYIHIDDFVDAAISIVDNWLRFQGKIVDIGTGKLVSVEALAYSMGYKGKVITDPTPNERASNAADTYLLRSVFKKKFKKII
ncbi:MAG: NAD(P)-dependent oxidoreductase [Muricauda sp. TMED12]|nr:MAG: NAD(P)-dependent oxidoreductase [Muricauda sp. TMED12]